MESHPTLAQAFAQRLVQMLQERGYTSTRSAAGVKVKPLADAMDCSTAMARKYVMGESMPDYVAAIKLGQWLKVHPGWLVFGLEMPAAEALPVTTTPMIKLESDLLRSILLQLVPLYQNADNVTEVVNFTLDVLYNISHIQADKPTILEIANLAIHSARRFQKSAAVVGHDILPFKSG